MAKKKFKQQYYTLDEEEVQALLQAAKAGDQAAQTKLLKVFDNFLTKYVSMLYHGRYNLGDYDIRRFIALFVKSPIVRRYLLRNSLSNENFNHVRETMNRITGMAQRYGEEEDTRQTVSMTFLQCVMRYERKGEIPFKGFLFNYFYYLLKKNVDLFLQDQLGRKTFRLLDDSDLLDDEDDMSAQGFYADPEPSAEELIGPNEIDEYWVQGETTLFPFDQLTVQERQLIKWRFIDNYRSSDIAKKITEHPNTVREHFNGIRRRLAELLEDVEVEHINAFLREKKIRELSRGGTTLSKEEVTEIAYEVSSESQEKEKSNGS